MKSIKFRVRGNEKQIVSAKNEITGAKIPKTGAKILHVLSEEIGNKVSKKDVCLQVWGNNDFFTRRSMDVHIHYVKKFLIGSGFKLHSTHGFLELEPIIK